MMKAEGIPNVVAHSFMCCHLWEDNTAEGHRVGQVQLQYMECQVYFIRCVTSNDTDQTALNAASGSLL